VSTLAERRQGPPAGLGVDVVGALNLVGSMFKPLGLAFLVPAALAAGYGEAVWPFLVSGAVTSGFGAALERMTHGKERVGSREGYLVVALLWLLVAVFGMLPYVFAEPQLANPVDAFFESMSGFSATGASVLTDIEGLSRSMAMWRQLTAWIGGLGIIVMFLAVLPRLNVGGRQALFKAEMPGPEVGLEDTIRETARRFVVLYVSLTALMTVVLAALGWTGIDDHMDLYRAVAHAFTTIATAGFSTEARSIEPFAPATQWAIALFMILAGPNFALLYLGFVRHRIRALTRDEELRVYLVLLVAASSLVLGELLSRDVLAGEEAVRNAVFNTTSMLTTTGFASSDFNAWPPLSLMVLFGVLLLGASAGSTSGSVKLVRHVVIAKMLRREIRQTVHPELVTPLRLNGNVIDERTLRAIIFFVLLYLGVLAAGAVAVLLDSSLRGLDVTAFDAFGDSATALAGAGPGLGFAGPMGSFAPFSDVSKLVLTIEMYLGRLEIVPVLVLLAGSYWRR
jgi:trk system potassium uptake protein TrkH